MVLIEETQNDGLFWVVVTESFLIYFEVLVTIVLPRLRLALVQQILLLIFDLIKFPARLPLPETQKGCPHVEVASNHVELDVTLAPPLHHLTSQQHFS